MMLMIRKTSSGRCEMIGCTGSQRAPPRPPTAPTATDAWMPGQGGGREAPCPRSASPTGGRRPRDGWGADIDQLGEQVRHLDVAPGRVHAGAAAIRGGLPDGQEAGDNVGDFERPLGRRVAGSRCAGVGLGRRSVRAKSGRARRGPAGQRTLRGSVTAVHRRVQRCGYEGTYASARSRTTCSRSRIHGTARWTGMMRSAAVGGRHSEESGWRRDVPTSARGQTAPRSAGDASPAAGRRSGRTWLACGAIELRQGGQILDVLGNGDAPGLAHGVWIDRWRNAERFKGDAVVKTVGT